MDQCFSIQKSRALIFRIVGCFICLFLPGLVPGQTSNKQKLGGFETGHYVNLPHVRLDPYRFANIPGVHRNITEEALFFLVPTVLENIVDEHIDVDLTHVANPAYHFDDCRFEESTRQINALQAEAVDKAVVDTDDAQDEFGKSLHIVQDFYAHTNWVELGNTDLLVNNNFGPWPVFKPFSQIHGNYLVQGEEPFLFTPGTLPSNTNLSRMGWVVHVNSGNANGVVSGSASPAGVLPSFFTSDDCPDSVVMSHGYLNKDTDHALHRFEDARALAVVQTRHEWCRFLNLVHASDPDGLTYVLEHWVDSDPELQREALRGCGLDLSIPNPQPSGGDAFGSVAIAPNGNLVVGAGRHSDMEGAVYVFNGEDGGLLFTIENPSPDEYDFFGHNVAVTQNGDILVAESHNGDMSGDEGIVRLFNGEDGSLRFRLNNPDPHPQDQGIFGRTIAVAANGHLVVSAWKLVGKMGIRERVYLFSGETGNLMETLDDPEGTLAANQFGDALASLPSGRIVIGAPDTLVEWQPGQSIVTGRVHVFTQSGGELFRIDNPHPESGDRFGAAVAATPQGHILVGANRDSWGANRAGSAYFFDGAGDLLLTIRNPSPQPNDYFGTTVATTPNGNLLVGAPYSDLGAEDAGTAYLFDGLTGELLRVIAHPDPQTDDRFSRYITTGLEGDFLIAAPGSDRGAQNSGMVFFFKNAIYAAFDSAQTAKNNPVGISVLSNDLDPNGTEPVVIQSLTSPSHGSNQIVGDQILYTPSSGFAGLDSFTYTIVNGEGSLDTASVFVKVADDPLTAVPVSLTTQPETTMTVPLAASQHTILKDGPLTFEIVEASVSGGSVGPVLQTGPDTAEVSFTPYVGGGSQMVAASFHYRISSGQKVSEAVPVVIEVENPVTPELKEPSGLVFGPDGHLYVSSSANDYVFKFHGETGAMVELTAMPVLTGGFHFDQGLNHPRDLAFYDQYLFIHSALGGTHFSGNALVHHGASGDYLAKGFDSQPDRSLEGGMTIESNKNLYFSGHGPGGGQVFRYSHQTGLVETFSSGRELHHPSGLVFDEQERLYVACGQEAPSLCGAVARFDGEGMWLNDFVASGSGGLQDPRGLVFGPDGHLYVADYLAGSVLRFHGETGVPIGDGVFVLAGSGGLSGPDRMTFGPDGDLFVSSSHTHQILRYDGSTGLFLDIFVQGAVSRTPAR